MMESFSQDNNRMDGYSYDAAGNLLNDGTTSYTYDAENRVISATNSSNGTSTYVYDADGRRVREIVGGATTDFLRDLDGNQMAAVSASGVWQRGEVYAGGRHLATYAGGTTYFNFTDHLGTERARAGVSGTLSETCTSQPFGDGLTCSGSDSSTMHFTRYEHDWETGNDYAEARHYGPNLGRFLSPDPLAGDVDDPQSLNRYAYVRNNPINLIDPSGLCPVGGYTYSDENGIHTTSFDDGTPCGDDLPVTRRPEGVGICVYKFCTGPQTNDNAPDAAPAPAPAQQQPLSQTFIGADPDFFHSKQYMCFGQGETAAVKDFLGGLVFANEIMAVNDSLQQGSTAPLWALVSAGTTSEVAEKGGEYVAGNRTAQKVIRSVTEGAISANAAGRVAGRRIVKVAEAFSAVLSLNAGREAYNKCRAD
jgi:RHS repeat-associated protein